MHSYIVIPPCTGRGGLVQHPRVYQNLHILKSYRLQNTSVGKAGPHRHGFTSCEHCSFDLHWLKRTCVEEDASSPNLSHPGVSRASSDGKT